MAMKLACRFGRHTWSSKVEQGETYTVCTACGKEHSVSLGLPPGSRFWVLANKYGPGGPGESPGGGGGVGGVGDGGAGDAGGGGF